MSATSFPKERIKVLLLENVHSSAEALFAAEGFHLETRPGALQPGELVGALRDVHVLGVRSRTKVPAEALADAKRLLCLGCFCIGTDQVDVAAANRAGVPVFNAPFSNTRSVAELVTAEVVALSRQLGDRSRELHAGTWRKVSTQCHEVRGKTLGIIGYGHIGSQVGVLAEALGMRVLYFDVASKLPMGNNRPVAALGELLEASDFVTLHVPDTAQTRRMVGAVELAKMRAGAYLLNASRGSVVDVPALAEALREGRLAGAAADVFPSEPGAGTEEFHSELQGLPNVLLTPHIGGSTEEAQEAIGREVATALLKFVNAGATTGAVNFPHVEVPPTPGSHRILNVHRNVPGVLGAVNRIVSGLGANIRSQVLSTDATVGYLVMDLEQDVSSEVKKAIAELPTSIRTRILY